jgi:hypothetical protein
VKVLLAGEGRDELGDWIHPPQYRARPPQPGLIEALLRRVAGDRFTVVDARVWHAIKKFKAGAHAQPETRNVLGLMLEAEELGCDALVFVRDKDRDDERERDIHEGLGRLGEGEHGAQVVGGCAVQEIEAWLLALLGEHGSEGHAQAKEALAKVYGIASLPQKVAVVESKDAGAVPADARSLCAWLEAAREVLGESSER